MEEELASATDELIQLAFQLPKTSGVELLLRLGECDVWRGDLGEMRDDRPRRKLVSAGSAPTAEQTTRAEQLYEALFFRQALDYLQPRCRETLYLRYV